MRKGKEAEKINESTIIEDSIIAGVILAKGHKIHPIKNPSGRVVYEIEGDVEKSIQEIYSNCSIGALDVLRAIKLTRSMIFNLRKNK